MMKLHGTSGARAAGPGVLVYTCDHGEVQGSGSGQWLNKGPQGGCWLDGCRRGVHGIGKDHAYFARHRKRNVEWNTSA